MVSTGRTYRALALGLPLVAIAIAALVAAAAARADVQRFAPRKQPVAMVSAFSGKDRYCDPWNFAKDPDCRDAKYQAPTAPAGATDATGSTGASGATGSYEPAMPGDWTWPAPPRGAYATINADGRTATAPKIAPWRVKRMIRAANSITKKPYVWGGGHVGWYAKGYDCSGATSFVLRAGGFVSWPMVSGELAFWGSNGAGRWVRVYANKTHVFMIIAGLRFDTSPWGPGESGPRWRAGVRTTKGFALRHPVRY